MNNAFYYLQQNENGFRVNLTDFNGQTILFGKQVEIKYAYKKYLQDMKTHLCFQTNYCRIRNKNGTYAFEIRTCWDDLIAESISFASRNERELAMAAVFDANKKAELREIALQPYHAHSRHLHFAS